MQWDQQRVQQDKRIGTQSSVTMDSQRSLPIAANRATVLLAKAARELKSIFDNPWLFIEGSPNLIKHLRMHAIVFTSADRHFLPLEINTQKELKHTFYMFTNFKLNLTFILIA